MTTDINPNLQTQQPLYTQQVIEQLPTNRATYLILDGAGFDALKLIFADGTTTPEFMLLYHDTQLNEQLKISPVIVRYDNNQALQSRIQEWLPYAIAFNTTTTLIDTVEHLKSLIYCELPNTQPAFFRFYGQNWLESLITGQDQSTLYAFTGPIDQWYIPSDQRWQQLTISEQRPSKTAEDYAWFKLTQELQQALSNFNYQQFVNTLTQRYTTEAKDSQVYQQTNKKIAYYVKEAGYYQFMQEDHVTEFVDLAMRHSQQIETEEALAIVNNLQELAINRINQLKNYLANV